MDAMQAHDASLDYIVRHPHEFKVPMPCAVGKEVRLYDHTGRLIGEPDVLFLTNNSYILVEHKNSDRHRARAMEQLATSREFLDTMLPGKCVRRIYHHGMDRWFDV